MVKLQNSRFVKMISYVIEDIIPLRDENVDLYVFKFSNCFGKTILKPLSLKMIGTYILYEQVEILLIFTIGDITFEIASGI